jgi:hypothetical protein
MTDNTWMHETIPYLPDGNLVYRAVCFILGRRKKKLSYQEMYLLLKEVNKDGYTEEECQQKAMERIIKIYKHFHNNNVPNVDNL